MRNEKDITKKSDWEFLVEYAIMYAKSKYDEDIPREVFGINGRLKRTLGWFRHFDPYVKDENGRRPVDRCRIELAGSLFKGETIMKVTMAVMLHEVTHWCLFAKGEEYLDKTEEFEKELRENSLSTNVTSYETESVVYKTSKEYKKFCPLCGAKFKGNAKKTKGKVSGWCSVCHKKEKEHPFGEHYRLHESSVPVVKSHTVSMYKKEIN